jgi:hypothetical protein
MFCQVPSTSSVIYYKRFAHAEYALFTARRCSLVVLELREIGKAVFVCEYDVLCHPLVGVFVYRYRAVDVGQLTKHMPSFTPLFFTASANLVVYIV